MNLVEQKNICVDMHRLLLLMKECEDFQVLKEAKDVHEYLKRSVLRSHRDVYIYNQILEMYSKCGSMEETYMVFNEMPQRNLTSWDTMITWLAKNSHEKMQLKY